MLLSLEIEGTNNKETQKLKIRLMDADGIYTKRAKVDTYKQ